MSTRDDLIEQAVKVMEPDDPEGRVGPQYETWRQSQRSAVRRAEKHARQLADAGLLREEPDESWEALMALLDKHWPKDVFPPPAYVDLDVANPHTLSERRDMGPVVIGLIRWVDQLRNPKAEADEETVELVARAIYAANFAPGDETDHWPMCDAKDYHRQRAHAALRALGEAP